MTIEISENVDRVAKKVRPKGNGQNMYLQVNSTDSCGRKKTRRGVGRWVRGRNRCGDRNRRSVAVELRGLARVTGKMEKLGWASNGRGRRVNVRIWRTMGGGKRR